MSLCRWSHSPFYIFEECGSPEGEIKVMGDGYFQADDILSNPIKNVYNRARESGYNIFHSIELLIWLYPWALCQKDKLTPKTYGKIIKFTRFLSYVRSYSKNNNHSYFKYIVIEVDDFIWEIEKAVVNDPIYKLSWEEKRKIFEEEGYLRKRFT